MTKAAAPTILGISAFYHDSAAAIVRGGDIVAAAQEERFSRKKHDPRFPVNAINYCLEEALIEPAELDAVVFYDDPLRTFDRVLKSTLAVAPAGLGVFERAAESLLGTKVWIEDHVRRAIGTIGRAGHVLCTEHHISHAASAFYPSPYESAAILTLDGVGEWATTTLGRGRGKTIELFAEIDYPHSLGLLYSAVTAYCGFKVNSGEYKLMGLAPYGQPRYYDAIRKNLIDVRPDGSYRLDMSYFAYLDSLTMTNERFHALFGGPPRAPESRITRREMDIAASIQKVTEEVVLLLARHVRAETGERNLVLAGGVALNCVANGKILSAGIYDDLWIQPAAGDAGGALGAALYAAHTMFGVERTPRQPDAQQGSYLGPRYGASEVEAALRRTKAVAERVTDRDERARRVAGAIADGKIVGFFSGRMEFGPRSLGARSILGDARRADTQAVMNLKIKYRESFRPFAPAVLEEEASRYFELDTRSPYMLLVAPIRDERRLPLDLDLPEGDDMLAVVSKVRSDIPAVTHVDYSARIQTVPADDHPDYRAVLEAFHELTGCAVIVNTSFNVRGEPIVCTPQDAYRCFMRTEIDLLVMEEYLLEKRLQPAIADDDSWRTEYELD